MPTVSSISLEDARAAIIGAQFPGGSDLAGMIARTGFVRALGGIDAYLAIRARLPEVKRAQIDAAVVRRELVVVPAVRGCIYLVSEPDLDLCLSIAEHLCAARTAREHERAGIGREELVALGGAIVKVLARGPLTTDALRRALPQGAVRSLGADARQKLGLYSTLSPALRRLEFERRIERVLDGGRLDSERYLWRATRQSPSRATQDESALYAGIARTYFAAAPIARLSELAEWAGISQADAQAAVEPLGMKEVAIAGEEGRFLATKRWRDHIARGREAVGFLPFEDNVPALHGGAALLVDRVYHGLQVPVWGSGNRTVEIGESKHMMLRSFVADGRIAGVWEYDPDRSEIAYSWFSPPSGAVQARLRDLAYSTTSFIHGELGHGRAVSLDTDEALRDRVAFVRRLAELVSDLGKPVTPHESTVSAAKEAVAPAKLQSKARPPRKPTRPPAKARPAAKPKPAVKAKAKAVRGKKAPQAKASTARAKQRR